MTFEISHTAINTHICTLHSTTNNDIAFDSHQISDLVRKILSNFSNVVAESGNQIQNISIIFLWCGGSRKVIDMIQSYQTPLDNHLQRQESPPSASANHVPPQLQAGNSIENQLKTTSVRASSARAGYVSASAK
ncbi:hypothetical protein KL950_001662 [Ogataea haglerorum]|uniref:Uncharacterized protein n=1 Tax=Ogataea haglerorum TaxID=1937702 RepID=A0ABQ7RKQ9_9ASCO|nr:hypothetical protein KL951_001421 [Ogataea haglerorum]KAG7710749.1 hypothetical protein KL950_001662 [Ogataea haglerorum]KAG7767452.1 hypothetical protein KL946_001551 [Ogataea haglerorum]KAG7775927.1 hypothetical protein KL922_003992 [Ogataea haglerorum]